MIETVKSPLLSDCFVSSYIKMLQRLTFLIIFASSLKKLGLVKVIVSLAQFFLREV